MKPIEWSFYGGPRDGRKVSGDSKPLGYVFSAMDPRDITRGDPDEVMPVHEYAVVAPGVAVYQGIREPNPYPYRLSEFHIQAIVDRAKNL